MNPDKPAHVVTEHGIHMIEYARPEYISRHSDAGIFFIYQDRGYAKLVDEYEFRKRELIINRKDPNFIRPARVYIKFLELEIKQYEDIIRAAQVEESECDAGPAVTEEEHEKFERSDTHYVLEELYEEGEERPKFTLGEGLRSSAPKTPDTEPLERATHIDAFKAMKETDGFEPQ